MKSSYTKTMLLLGLAGVLFSGYLSAVKFFTSTCAFNEPCPYFLGYPACWYGLAMFLIIFLAAILASLKKISDRVAAKTIAIVSGLGIIFAAYFTIPEINSLFSGISNYTLGLPTCVYGLIFYILIFVISVRHLYADNI